MELGALDRQLGNKLATGLVEMGLQLSTDQQAKLISYVQLIHKWNKVHNLTAVRDPLEMVTLHILDSLSVLPHVIATKAQYLLDVGAGAGLPSIPLAICLPALQVTAIDAVQKKASFMRQVKGELGLANFHVESSRVEILKKERFNQGAGFDVIISRAFSEIALFMKLTRHLLAERGVWLAMKGVLPVKEFELAAIKPSAVEVLHVAELDAARHLIVIDPHQLKLD